MFKHIMKKYMGLCKDNIRKFSQCLPNEHSVDSFKMQAWQVHSYGEDLQLSSSRIPIIHDINEVLVKVEAASVNPIDLYMQDGYARTVLSVFRKCEMELPLTLGRDFCGTIVNRGLATNDKFKLGDKVYGFVPLHKQGSFGEYLLINDSHICHHPEHLTSVESASIVYAAMTAWSALFLTGRLQFESRKDKRVLILGASGGVGTMAVQLLKSQGIHVTGTCSSDAVLLVRSLGADDVLDYTDKSYLKQIAESRFDIILDCAKFGIENVPKNWKFKQFITLNSPLMVNTDQYGLVGGFLKSGSTLLYNNLPNMTDGKIVKWGFFIPSGSGFTFINDLVKNKEIKPMIHAEFAFPDLLKALSEVKKGHLRGKVVIKF